MNVAQDSEILASRLVHTSARSAWTTAKRLTALVALVLGFFTFGLQYHLATALDSHGDITMPDSMFDGDSEWYIINFETGKSTSGSYGGRGLIHPNIANLVHPPVAFIAAGLKIFRPSTSTRDVALAVAPFLAGVRTVFLFLALTASGFTLADALLATALSIAAFSSVLFGALPESYCISSAIFAFIYYLVAKSAQSRNASFLYWAIGGTLIFGTTVTNLVPVVLLFAIVLAWHNGIGRFLFQRTARLVTVSIVSTALIFLVLTAAHGAYKDLRLGGGQLREVKPSIITAIARIPRMGMYSLVTALPNRIVGLDYSRQPVEKRVTRFTFRDNFRPILNEDSSALYGILSPHRLPLEVATALICISLLFLSGRALGQSTGILRLLFLCAVAHLLFNWVLHSLFGNELFLYSQHWIAALTIVLCLGMTTCSPLAWFSRAGVAALTIAAAIQSSAAIHLILSER